MALTFDYDTQRNCNLRMKFREDRAPSTLLVRKNELLAVPYEEASHLLVDRLDRAWQDGEVTLDVYGVAMAGYSISVGSCTYLYARADQYIVTRQKAVLALLTRHFCGQLGTFYYNDPCRATGMFQDRMPERDENPTLSHTQLLALPMSKVSGGHHIHFTAAEVYDIVKESDGDRSITATRLPTDATTTMGAGVILWYCALEPYLAKLVRRSGLFKTRTMAEFAKVGKEISVAAKSFQNITDVDLRQVFEIEVLVNRVTGEVDWQTEKQNRLKPQLAQIDEDVVYNRSVRIFQNAFAAGRRPVAMSWRKFWANRWQWSAAGSIHSQHKPDMDYVIRTTPELKNKFITITNMPTLEMEYFSRRRPEIAAWSSTKYEWGKQRAIYGTDLTSYVLAHFAFYNCENVLPPQFPVGRDAGIGNVSNRVAGVLTNKLPFCLDYADFNSQHSAEAMHSVIRAYGDVFHDWLTPEQLSALDWTAHSTKRLIVHDNIGTGTSYTAKGTLLSGWRLTTFMNSVLNYVYTRAITKEYLSQGQSLHNGDDVLIGSNNIAITQACLRNARAANIRIQPAKCAFGGIAEFLRVDHVHGSHGQYLTRALATCVHSRIESRPSTDARDLVSSMEMRFDDAINRGLPIDYIARLRERYYERQSTICGNTVSEMYMIKLAHRVVGGISEAKDANIDYKIEPGLLVQGEVEVPDLPGIYDYARELQDELKLEVKQSEINRRVKRATYEAILVKNRKMRIKTNNENAWYSIMKALHKAHRDGIPTGSYGKAALTGFAIDIIQRDAPNTTLARFLQTSKHPMRALGLVT